MKKPTLFVISLCLLVMSACQTSQKQSPAVIETQAPLISGKPEITSLLDLGSLPLSVGKDIPVNHSDARYSPGEWLLVKGKNLGVQTLTIDGNTLPVEYYFAGQPLVRLPTGLMPLEDHQLTINNGIGRVSTSFTSTHYIVATDTDGKARHLIRTNPKQEGGVEEDWIALELDEARPMYSFFSADSAYLFTVNIKERAEKNTLDDANAYIMEVRTLHAAAPEKPQQIARAEFLLDSAPTDAMISSDNKIVLLGKQSFTLLDASNARQIRSLHSGVLPLNQHGDTIYVDALFFADNSRLAFLETYSNRIAVLDAQKPELLLDYALLPEKSIALSVDLEADPHNSNQFWVLLGPNFRLTGTKLADQYKKWVHKESTPEDKRTIHRLVKLQWQENTLTEVLAHELDNKYAAYFARADERGDIYITTTKMAFLTENFGGKSRSEMLKATKSILWDVIAFGRVVKVNAATGLADTVASGVGIYYHFQLVPGIGPVFSLMKFGPALSMPFISPNWGLGIKSTGTYAKRKMNKRAIFPPYSVGHVAYQH